MFAGIQNRLMTKLSKGRFGSDDDVFLYTSLTLAVVLCIVIHAYLLALFLYIPIRELWIVNIFSVTIYILMLPMIKARKYTLVGFVVSIEVLVYATLSTILYGCNTYIIGHQLIAIVLQIIIPYTRTARRVWMAVLGVLSVVAGFVVCATSGTIYKLEARYENLIMISNAVIMIAGITAQVLAGNLLRNAIRKYSDSRIEELSSQVNTDPLTGLYNRRYAEQFFKRLEGERRVNYCVAMVDIDDFKQINDTLGHPVGDEVLKYLAGYMQGTLRQTDSIFRWGGEEFLIVLESATLPVAFKVLEKIRAGIEQSRIPTEKGEVSITITIGAAVLDTKNSRASIETSDKKLYYGKRNNKNVVVI